MICYNLIFVNHEHPKRYNEQNNLIMAATNLACMVTSYLSAYMEWQEYPGPSVVLLVPLVFHVILMLTAIAFLPLFSFNPWKTEQIIKWKKKNGVGGEELRR